MPSIAAMPNSATKPMAADTLNGVPVDQQRENAAHQRHRNHARRQQRIAQRAEIQVQQQQISSDRRAAPPRRAAPAPPADCRIRPPIRAGSRPAAATCCSTALLRLEHRAAQIAAAHAELDRHVALLLLAIDECGAGDQVDVGHIARAPPE